MKQKFCNGIVHVIKEGDTLYQLSRAYRVPVALLMRANPYVDVYNLQIGQELCIPLSRPFPGMFPGFGRPPMIQPRGNETDAFAEEAQDSEDTTDPCEDVTPQLPPGEEETGEPATITTDGQMTLGDILEQYHCSLEEFMKYNDLCRLILKENVVITLPCPCKR